MFPEVFFMDVIANTNCQKRDLFLVVTKDATEECFIDNATLLSCGKVWVFTKLYRYFFCQLYGPVTLSRIRLALTDKGSSQGSFDAATHVVACYANTKHMLCMRSPTKSPPEEKIPKEHAPSSIVVLVRKAIPNTMF